MSGTPVVCRRWLAACPCAVVLFSFLTLRGAELPPGFHEEILVQNINAATAMTVAPDGRLFFAEQTGYIRVWKDDRLLPTPALDISERLDHYWERGLIGLTLHPEFPRAPHLFIVYVAKSPYTHHVVSRFTMAGDWVDPNSERILLEGDDQSKLGGGVPAGHQGGPIVFGPDGKLYIAIGEQTAGQPSQALDTFQGKILRINPDGTIPEDNPFYDEAAGKYRAIWAIGLRNPYGLAFEPGTGRLFASDVGGSAFEEINVIVKGGNYGWPHAEGESDNDPYIDPFYAYPRHVGKCISGGLFYPKSAATENGRSFPEKWRGKFFFLDWADNWLKAIDPHDANQVETFAKGFDSPVWLETAPDGSMYVLNRGTIWRDGEKFQQNSGSLVQIHYPGASSVQDSVARAEPPPPTLRATKLFSSTTPFVPKKRFREFQINQPPWQPGLKARRWLALPRGKKIAFSIQGEWGFPQGALLIQHYQLDHEQPKLNGKPFETHLFWFKGPRRVRAAAYHWDENGDNAELVRDVRIVPIPGRADSNWLSPAFDLNLDIDTALIGFALPVNTRQLNQPPRAAHTGAQTNPLKEWNERHWFEPPIDEAAFSSLPRLFPLNDRSASLQERVRSYLDVNCASCHRPGGLSRGNFDARFQTPLEQQKIINGELLAGDLGIQGAAVVVPGDPEKSIMHQRVKRNDLFRMPPVSFTEAPQPVLPLLKEWIQNLD